MQIKTDWALPLTSDGKDGKIMTVSLEDDIKQSLFTLLSTSKGERLMRPDYGCDLNAFAFENVTYSLITKIQNEVYTAIRDYEPRIDNIKIEVSEDSANDINIANELIIHIIYNIKGSDEVQSFEYRMNDKL